MMRLHWRLNMQDLPRKKSPRAPSTALDEALDRAMKAYDKERLHPAPTDVVAQNLGYKGASSGTALAAMASLRYYGLLVRPREGFLAVSKDVEAYKFAPSEELRHSFLLGFLRRPALFAELLDKYASGLPSDANLKYDLIQRGFLPATAASLVQIFRRSVEFAGFFDYDDEGAQFDASTEETIEAESTKAVAHANTSSVLSGPAANPSSITKPPPGSTPAYDESAHDRIPVRLPGGRRALLWIPTPFFAADKQRIKAQIDILLTEDDGDDVA
jgi:hypothetical protein